MKNVEKKDFSKKESKTQEKTEEENKGKEGPKGLPQETDQKIVFFYTRTVKRNLNEIETQKKSDFEHPTKKKKKKEEKKMKENVRT